MGSYGIGVCSLSSSFISASDVKIHLKKLNIILATLETSRNTTVISKCFEIFCIPSCGQQYKWRHLWFVSWTFYKSILLYVSTPRYWIYPIIFRAKEILDHWPSRLEGAIKYRMRGRWRHSMAELSGKVAVESCNNFRSKSRFYVFRSK